MNNCNKMQCQCRVPQRSDQCQCRENSACPINFGTCSCKGTPLFEESFALAMGYVPVQKWEGITDCEDSLYNGTVFPSLVKPFLCAGRRRGL